MHICFCMRSCVTLFGWEILFANSWISSVLLCKTSTACFYALECGDLHNFGCMHWWFHDPARFFPEFSNWNFWTRLCTKQLVHYHLVLSVKHSFPINFGFHWKVTKEELSCSVLYMAPLNINTIHDIQVLPVHSTTNLPPPPLIHHTYHTFLPHVFCLIYWWTILKRTYCWTACVANF
jgi:hypothetical protein